MDSKKWYESTTMRNALVGIITGVLTIITFFTGRIFDLTIINGVIDKGFLLAPVAVMTWNSVRAWSGRKNADTVIEK